MWKDPIIEEVRAVRRQLAQEAGNDLHEICRRLGERELSHLHRMVAATISPTKRRKTAPKRETATATTGT